MGGMKGVDDQACRFVDGDDDGAVPRGSHRCTVICQHAFPHASLVARTGEGSDHITGQD